MSSDKDTVISEWNKQKFEIEMKIKMKHLSLSEKQLRVENRRNLLIGALVPIVVALLTAVPAYINSANQLRLQQVAFSAEQRSQQAAFEAELVIDSIKTGDPNQAAVNLKFLADSGLLSRDTADQISRYLAERTEGTGRTLPPK